MASKVIPLPNDRQKPLPLLLTPLNGRSQCLKTEVHKKDTRKKALRMSSR